MYGAAAAEVTGQTRGSKDNLGQDNAQLRPDAHLPSNCNNCLWHTERSGERNKEMGGVTKNKQGHPCGYLYMNRVLLHWQRAFMCKYHHLVKPARMI